MFLTSSDVVAVHNSNNGGKALPPTLRARFARVAPLQGELTSRTSDLMVTVCPPVSN